HVPVAGVCHPLSLPCVPRAGGNRMRSGTDRKKIQNRVLAVVVPTAVQEAGLRLPSVRQQERVSIQHPSKINALVDLGSERDDLGVGVELCSRGENPGQQKRGVNRGNLALPSALAGLQVHPMIEPAVHVFGAAPEKTKRGSQPRLRIVVSDPFSVGADAQRRETKARRADARDVVTRVFVSHSRTVGTRAIKHETGAEVRLFDEVREAAMTKLFEKLCVVFFEFVERVSSVVE